MPPHELIMYTRQHCPLCEIMREQVEALISGRGWALKSVDIAGNRELEHDYGLRIPVLCLGGTELCFGRLDSDLLEEVITGEA